MCLAQGPHRSDAREARTQDPRGSINFKTRNNGLANNYLTIYLTMIF